MKKVYVVFDEDSCVDKIFDTEEKARNYIKNDPFVIEEMEDMNCTWEDYFDSSADEVLMIYREYNLE